MLSQSRERIKTPLRYPGGKAKALDKILPLVPEFDELREPFVGGGSVFIRLKQLYPDKRFWINDINEDLFAFWITAQADLAHLVAEIRSIRNSTTQGRTLFSSYRDEAATYTQFQRAVRFFIMNRITFSGTVDSGGYSEQAFNGRFTESAINNLENLESILRDVRITDDDYAEVVNAPGDRVFIFLDPPYFSATKSRLYGKNGDLHTGFDHERFAATMKNCPHTWLITYDDSPEIRQLFCFANIATWELQYGMNNYKQPHAEKGRELFISNYDMPHSKKGLRQLSFFDEREYFTSAYLALKVSNTK